jgi:spore coat polysaccharide biosynthesis protein SpsF
MKTILITQARMGSTRLPGKVLKVVNEQTLLEIHLNRLRQCRNVNEIIVATTLADADEIIEKLAQSLNFKVYRGSENDVLDRYYNAVLPYQAEWVVRVTSDCPLLDPALVDDVIKIAIEKNVDYCSNTIDPHFPDGQDIEVFKFSALERAWKEAKLISEREHVTPYIWGNTDLKGGRMFTGFSYIIPENYGHLRMTVDEPNDFKVVEQLIQKLGNNKTWLDYTKFIINDELSALNNQYSRNEGYQKSVNKDGK